MFCPMCEAEYREGYTSCSDCHIPLVEKLQEKPEQPTKKTRHAEVSEFKPVLTAHNDADIALIKSILDEEDIAYFFQNEIVHLAGEPAILMVQAEKVEDVLGLIQDLDIRFALFGPDRE